MEKHELEVETKSGHKMIVSVSHYVDNQTDFKELTDEESKAKVKAYKPKFNTKSVVKPDMSAVELHEKEMKKQQPKAPAIDKK